MKIKKLLALLLAVVMIFSLVGCGAGSNEIEYTEDGKRILKVEYLKAGYGTQFFIQAAKAFMEEHDDIQVKLIPNENVNGETEVKLSSEKNINDVYYVSYWSAVRRWAVKGYVEDISDIYDQEVVNGKTLKNSISEYTRELCKTSGKYFAIPNEASINGLIYNVGMFDENKWELPKTTKELYDFYDIVKQANLKVDIAGHLNTVTPITYCGKANDGYWNSLLATWWLQCSGKDALDTFFKFESPEVFKDQGRLVALETLQQLAFSSEYLPQNIMSKDAMTAQLDFLQGKAAMIPCGSWFAQEMAGYMINYPNTKFAMLPTPVVSNMNTGASLAKDTDNYFWEGSESCWFIPKGAANKGDAKEFLKFLAKEEVSELWTKYTGGLRTYEYDTSETSDIYKNSTLFTQSMMDIWNTCKPYKMITSNPMAIGGYLGIWPQQSSPYVKLSGTSTTPKQYFDEDYAYVSHEWDKWKSMYNMP